LQTPPSLSILTFAPSITARATFHNNHVCIPTRTKIITNTTRLPNAMNRNKTVASSCAGGSIVGVVVVVVVVRLGVNRAYQNTQLLNKKTGRVEPIYIPRTKEGAAAYVDPRRGRRGVGRRVA
jgi:hypothetical protein